MLLRALLFAAMLLPSVISAQDWRYVTETDAFRMHIDVSSIQWQAATARVWIAQDFHSMQTGSVGSYRSLVALQRIDCDQETLQVLRLDHYAGQFGTGAIVQAGDEYARTAITARPGTVSHGIVRAVCDRRFKLFPPAQ